MPPSARVSPAAAVPCRICGRLVPGDPLTCPQCQAPRPARATFAGEGYELKSVRTFRGRPLLHIAFGIDALGKIRTARGVIAVGQRAVGLVAVGIIASGIISIGVVALGVVSIGAVAVGAFAAAGLQAVAPFAAGAAAVGYCAAGLAAFGYIVRSPL